MCDWCKIREEEVKKLREVLAKRPEIPQASISGEQGMQAQPPEETL